MSSGPLARLESCLQKSFFFSDLRSSPRNLELYGSIDSLPCEKCWCCAGFCVILSSILLFARIHAKKEGINPDETKVLGFSTEWSDEGFASVSVAVSPPCGVSVGGVSLPQSEATAWHTGPAGRSDGSVPTQNVRGFGSLLKKVKEFRKIQNPSRLDTGVERHRIEGSI